jgi:hypothetical protein
MIDPFERLGLLQLWGELLQKIHDLGNKTPTNQSSTGRSCADRLRNRFIARILQQRRVLLQLHGSSPLLTTTKIIGSGGKMRPMSTTTTNEHRIGRRCPVVIVIMIIDHHKFIFVHQMIIVPDQQGRRIGTAGGRRRHQMIEVGVAFVLDRAIGRRRKGTPRRRHRLPLAFGCLQQIDC